MERDKHPLEKAGRIASAGVVAAVPAAGLVGEVREMPAEKGEAFSGLKIVSPDVTELMQQVPMGTPEAPQVAIMPTQVQELAKHDEGQEIELTDSVVDNLLQSTLSLAEFSTGESWYTDETRFSGVVIGARDARNELFATSFLIGQNEEGEFAVIPYNIPLNGDLNITQTARLPFDSSIGEYPSVVFSENGGFIPVILNNGVVVRGFEFDGQVAEVLDMRIDQFGNVQTLILPAEKVDGVDFVEAASEEFSVMSGQELQSLSAEVSALYHLPNSTEVLREISLSSGIEINLGPNSTLIIVTDIPEYRFRGANIERLRGFLDAANIQVNGTQIIQILELGDRHLPPGVFDEDIVWPISVTAVGGTTVGVLEKPKILSDGSTVRTYNERTEFTIQDYVNARYVTNGEEYYQLEAGPPSRIFSALLQDSDGRRINGVINAIQTPSHPGSMALTNIIQLEDTRPPGSEVIRT